MGSGESSDFVRTNEGEGIVTWSEHLDRPSRKRCQSAPWAEFFGVVDSLHIRMRPGDFLLLAATSATSPRATG